jgi:hypothetical protein
LCLVTCALLLVPCYLSLLGFPQAECGRFVRPADGAKDPFPTVRPTTFRSQKNAQVKHLKIKPLFQMEIS